ncbi:zf-MYND and TPR domain-containing protein [Skeletonema marinoi]|uniref:Zf-MYND and TPR domain-containing protein n=1 Tax=Skeletonema marinoi TaxID=267567 RepID=A0AAD8XXQ2_9STRA|nr:zf-MYND and TPR domain-containing protein [Skeletonema marinoi]
MSADDCEAGVMMMMSCCASCGIAERDEIKLRECATCDLVRYCGDKCQENHTAQHERACMKRAVELRDEILFKQPESSYLADCPICCLPMPLDLSKSIVAVCCSKSICRGCDVETQKREFEPVGNELWRKQRMKRIEANDPVAMCREGAEQYKKGDYSSAFGYYVKAAELGDVDAHYRLSLMYYLGKGVEKDGGKEIYHLEEAAIGGHPTARCGLGCHEWRNGNTERAVKHLIIAASMGHDGSIKFLMDEFRRGFVSKDDLAAALRAHQAAVDATKSPQREEAEACDRIRDTMHAKDSN